MSLVKSDHSCILQVASLVKPGRPGPFKTSRGLTLRLVQKDWASHPPHGFKVQSVCEIEVSRFVGPQTNIHGSFQFTCKPEIDFILRLQTNTLTEPAYSLFSEFRAYCCQSGHYSAF